MTRRRGDSRAGEGAGLDLAAMRQVLVRAVERHCPADLSAHREDFVQLALTRLLESGRAEESAGVGASYLWKMAFTLVIDEIRRHRRQQRHASERATLALSDGPEARVEILDCLGRLQERRRAAVALHLEGFRTAEVATILGCGDKQAENLIYRGLADLRGCLEGGTR